MDCTSKPLLDLSTLTNKKIADVKLAKHFQAVLKEFQKAQRLSAERETAYTPFVLLSTLLSSEVDATSDRPPEQSVPFSWNPKDREYYSKIMRLPAIIDGREKGIQGIQ